VDAKWSKNPKVMGWVGTPIHNWKLVEDEVMENRGSFGQERGKDDMIHIRDKGLT
jgi:hypothetical protein